MKFGTEGSKSQKEIVTSYIDDPMPTVLISQEKIEKKPRDYFCLGSVYELFRVGVGKTSNPSY